MDNQSLKELGCFTALAVYCIVIQILPLFWKFWKNDSGNFGLNWVYIVRVPYNFLHLFMFFFYRGWQQGPEQSWQFVFQVSYADASASLLWKSSEIYRLLVFFFFFVMSIWRDYKLFCSSHIILIGFFCKFF